MESSSIWLLATLLLFKQVLPITIFEAKEDGQKYLQGHCQHSNPCLNNCTCVSIGNVDYYCNNSFSGFLGKNCSKSPPNVSCGDEQITVNIPKWMVLSMIASYKHNDDKESEDEVVYVSSFDMLQRQNKDCFARKAKLSSGETIYKATLKIPFQTCGTSSQVLNASKNEEEIIFKNSVWWRNSFQEKHKIPLHLYSFTCSSKNKKLISSAVNPKCCEEMPVATPFGKIKLVMNYWKSPPVKKSLSPPLEPPFAYVINQKIFVTVRTLGKRIRQFAFNLQLVDCYLSPSFKRNYTAKSMSIIKHGSFFCDYQQKRVCRRKPYGCRSYNIIHCRDFSILCVSPMNSFKAAITKNGLGEEAAFYFHIGLLKNLTSFYLHCQAQLCLNNCTRVCHDGKINTSSQQYFEETRSQKNAVFLHGTMGPVKVYQELNVVPNATALPVKDQYASIKQWAVPSMLAISTFICIALLGVLCYTVARSVETKRHSRLRRLTGESLFMTTDLSNIDESIAICRKADCSLKSKKYFRSGGTSSNKVSASPTLNGPGHLATSSSTSP